MSDAIRKLFNAPSYFPKRIIVPGLRAGAPAALSEIQTPLERRVDKRKVEPLEPAEKELLEYGDDPTKPAVPFKKTA